MRSSGSETGPGREPQVAALAEAVARARADEVLLARLREILRRADAEIALLGASCLGGGACCRFDLAGHRLYATTAELALLTLSPPTDASRAAAGRCPYQRGPRCTAHERRPLGCRSHFCRGAAPEALAAVYERAHRLIRQLHRRRGAAYLYAELTAALTKTLADAGFSLDRRTRGE